MSNSVVETPKPNSDPDHTIEPRRTPPARIRIRPPSIGPTQDAPSDDVPTVPPALAPADYKVGYAKPPTRHQFQPGRSGNPKGRPKGSRSLSTLIGEELDKTVAAKMGARRVTMSRRQAMVHRVIEMAMQGDLKAFVVLLKLDPTAAASDSSAPEPEAKLSPEEAEMLQAFLKRAGGGEPDGAS
ncbi:MAG: hypothetical protein JWO83_1547 [Caulobacteraceae bacterium]|nr:hypothetical protein [Caulobacteraceae bacterium]